MATSSITIMMSQEDIVGALAAPSRHRRFTPLTPHGLPRPPRSPGFSDAGSSIFPPSQGGSSIHSPRSVASSSILSPRSVVSSNTSYSTSSERSYFHRFDPMSPNPTAFSIPSFVSVIDLDGSVDAKRRLPGSSSTTTRASHYRNKSPKSLGIDLIQSGPHPLLLSSAFSPLHSPKVPKLKRLGMRVKSAFKRTRRLRDLSYGGNDLWGDDDEDMEYERIETVHWTEQ